MLIPAPCSLLIDRCRKVSHFLYRLYGLEREKEKKENKEAERKRDREKNLPI